ncbi:MAG: GldG family protein [Clostridiales bacterium]|jgi:ABC-type uncharacterized transport system involved in gliding motility auxiliary subunit|nr:GldG family protein [Eubacteriales bacterium]MDH7566442.1 GldG family protein [Clostridiales bacterium]
MKRMDRIKEFFKSINFNYRSLKYGSLSIFSIAVVIAIAVVLNLLVNYIENKNIIPLKLDLTANKIYSLGDESKKILNGLQKDVTIYGIFDESAVTNNSDYKEVTELLSQYEKFPHIKVQYVDLDKNPRFVNTIDPNNTKKIQKGDLVVKSGNKIKPLSYYDIFNVSYSQQTFQQLKTGTNAEGAVTGAIQYVTSDKTPVVYFTEGHGEHKVDTDFNTVKDYLERNNYEVKSLNLTTVEKVPQDAEILIVAAPKSDLTSDEEARLNEFLERGARAVFMFDPLDTNTKLIRFEEVLKKFNVSLNYDRVKENDDNRHIPKNNYDILPDVQSNEINSALDPQNFAMIMPASRSLNILNNEKSAVTVTQLMQSSDKAVGEQIDKTNGKDIPGPLDLAVASEYNEGGKSQKILVLGNGSFMTDSAINKYQTLSINGLYFFLNSLSWLQDRKEATLIPPKSYDTSTISISEAQAGTMSLVVVVLVPLIILGFGTFIWMRRRHL